MGGSHSAYTYGTPKNKFEVIDLEDSTNICNFDPQSYNLNLKKDTWGVGGLIDNNYPYFCGGRTSTADFDSNKPVCLNLHKNMCF